jgi:hypothetical protein
MLKFQDKPLEDLTMEESIEFEKMVLKRVLTASNAGMSDSIIDQLNNFLNEIRFHKQEKIAEFVESSKKQNSNDNEQGLLIGEEKQQSSDNID